jgi:outer membrane receptor for ferrienterochelin and colicins
VASASYHWLKYDLTFNVDYKFTGTTPQVEIDENQQLVEGYVSSYNMLDINVGRNFFKDMLGISAGVKNLLDVTTVPSTGGQTGTAHSGGSASVPIGWGRTFFIRATINFSKI